MAKKYLLFNVELLQFYVGTNRVIKKKLCHVQKKKQLGVGTKCEALKRVLHPRPLVCEKYPNSTAQDRLDELLVIKKEKKKINGSEKICIVFRHDDFDNQEIYCSERYAKVLTEGNEVDFFTDVTVQAEEEKDALDDADEATLVPVLGTSDLAENIARVRMEGYNVDDDNEPAPENVPDTAQTTNTADTMYGEWNSCTICHRLTEGLRHEKAKLLCDIDNGPTSSYLDYYIYFLPTDYIQNILLKESNKAGNNENITWGELLVYIGLWFLMASTATGCDRRSYWDNSPTNPWNGAPYRFNEYMSLTRFDYITKILTFHSPPFPEYTDKFHEVRELLQSYNDHMKKVFIPSWISCLDESMSSWTSRWTCPGWMYVPRKPHPYGNEYHTIACGESGILYALEIVEGKSRPREKAKEKYSELGTTAGLLLRLCEAIFDTGKIVVLDSGFCVLQALIELKKKGVYASALVKKRRYWPKYVKGDEIKLSMKDDAIGVTKRLPGELDGVKFDLFCLKEPDYVMTLMSTYGSLNAKSTQKDSVRYSDDGNHTTFKYNVVVGNHFDYRDSVDSHNGKRHDCGTKQGLSIEETWRTNRWPCRVFSFILALTEVNAFNAMKYFGSYQGTQWEFRKKLAYQMIHNAYDVDTKKKGQKQRRNMRSGTHHELMSAPPFSKFIGSKWSRKYRMKYQQHTCNSIGCKNRVRTVCTCSKHIWRCSECFSKHCIEVARASVPAC